MSVTTGSHGIGVPQPWTKYLYAWGRITYLDGFGKERRTHFFAIATTPNPENPKPAVAFALPRSTAVTTNTGTMQIKGIAVRLASGLIYTLVIASLMIHAVALALMADSALAAEPEVPDLNLKPLFDFLDMLDRSWLGTIKNFNPNAWNGVWPEPSKPSNPSMAIYFERGGVIKEHIERWHELARSGADVEILGPCYSACTLIVTYVPKERLCFGAFATLQFHLASDRETGKPSLDASLWMLKQYPREIYDWIMERWGRQHNPSDFLGASGPKFVEMGLSPMQA